MQISPNAKRFFLLAWIVIKGFFGPVSVALAIILYGLYAPWQPPDHINDALKSFFAVLFFVMFFYGQYKRVEKQSDDKDSFKHVNDQLLSLKDLVNKIPFTKPENPSSQRVKVGDAESLLTESRELLESGHVLAALLQGGVAFEHAIRSFARNFKGDETANAPLHNLIQRIAPQEMMGELHALRIIRNRLTHISENELTDLPDANRVLSGYEWAVSELTKIVKRENSI